MQQDEQVQPAEELRILIGKFQSLKTDPAVDKKWLNKIVARLEEVDAFTGRLYKPSSLDNPANIASLEATSGRGVCTCPMPFVRDSSCAIHGTKAMLR